MLFLLYKKRIHAISLELLKKNLNNIKDGKNPVFTVGRDTLAEQYVEMWKELGINLERHDQLLNALTQHVEETILTQKNRPKKTTP